MPGSDTGTLATGGGVAQVTHDRHAAGAVITAAPPPPAPASHAERPVTGVEITGAPCCIVRECRSRGVSRKGPLNIGERGIGKRRERQTVIQLERGRDAS